MSIEEWAVPCMTVRVEKQLIPLSFYGSFIYHQRPQMEERRLSHPFLPFRFMLVAMTSLVMLCFSFFVNFFFVCFFLNNYDMKSAEIVPGHLLVCSSAFLLALLCSSAHQLVLLYFFARFAWLVFSSARFTLLSCPLCFARLLVLLCFSARFALLVCSFCFAFICSLCSSLRLSVPPNR